MAKKQNMKKAATTKSAASVQINSSETKLPADKTTSKWRKFRSKLPPVFCESTTHEDKLCIFSFCCGIVLMACLFFGDLFIRNYLETRHWEEQVLHTLQIKLESYNTKSEQSQVDKVIIVNQEDGVQKRIIKSSFQKKIKTNKTGHIAKPAKKFSLASIPCRPPIERQAQFITEEYVPYGKQGHAEITGSVCKNLPEGVPCPETVIVFANPVTSYSNEWWNVHWKNGQILSQADKRTNDYRKNADVKADGTFEFKNLSDGQYYVAAETCAEFDPDDDCHPIRLGAQITLKNAAYVDLDIVSLSAEEIKRLTKTKKQTISEK